MAARSGYVPPPSLVKWATCILHLGAMVCRYSSDDPGHRRWASWSGCAGRCTDMGDVRRRGARYPFADSRANLPDR